jgi:allantoin racemase
MKISGIDPDTSGRMTNPIRGEMEMIKRSDAQVTVENLKRGPASIRCAIDEVLAGPGILELLAGANAEG